MNVSVYVVLRRVEGCIMADCHVKYCDTPYNYGLVSLSVHRAGCCRLVLLLTL